MHEITAQDVAEVGDIIAKLPQEMRAQATLETHAKLAELLLQQGKFVGPDGKIRLISNQKQAESLAQKYINEEIGRQDAQAKKAVNEPVPAPPAGFTLDETPKTATASAATSPGEETSTPRFAKGDRVVLPDGREGTIAHAHPRMNITRVVTDNGERVSIGAAKLKAAGAPATGLGSAAGPSTPAPTPGVESQNEVPSSAATGAAAQPQGEGSARVGNVGEPTGGKNIAAPAQTKRVPRTGAHCAGEPGERAQAQWRASRAGAVGAAFRAICN